MISRTIQPKNKQELLRAIQLSTISELSVIEGNDTASMTKKIKAMELKPGHISVVLLRMKD